MYLMKGMAVLAMGLVAASCNKKDFDQSAYQQAKEQESQEQFMNNVMGGKSIDPNQTWSTTKSVSVTVTPQKDGTLKIYAANPIGNTVAPLYTTTAVAGKETTFTVTRPADVEMLYATVLNEDGLIADLLAFNATEASVTVDMTDDTTTRSISRRAPQVPTYTTFGTTNPITEPDTPTNLPTSDNADYKFTSDGNLYWDGKNKSNKTVYIASGVTVTFNGDWDGFSQDWKIYMGPGSKIINKGIFYMGNRSILYNDGGTIETGKLQLEEATIWNAGTIDIDTNELLFSDNGNGATIFNCGTIKTGNFQVGQKGTLWNEGTVTCTGTLKGNNSSSQIYNGSGHNMTAARLELNNNSQYLWNDGTLTITGAIYSTNNATCINNGTLNAQSFDGSAGISFLNRTDKTVNISGGTTITNANSLWVNDGIYNTGTFLVQAGNSQVFNNCRLNVKGKFTMGNNDGSRFVLQGDASVICDSFDWNGDNYFFMGGGSLLKVANTLKSNNQNSDKGFFNTTSEYAVISANAITTDNPNGQWRAWYEGKIYVDTDKHFDLIKINDGQSNVKLANGALLTGQQGTALVEWEESTCRPEYKGKKKDPDPIMYYYYAFEDLGSVGDFDFNDVVLRVSAPEDRKSKVEAMAAGGTLPVQVTYNGRDLGSEVHNAFSERTSVMINTGAGATKDPVNIGYVDVASDANMAELPFGITVSGASSIQVTNSVENRGKAPLMIVVSGYPTGTNAGEWFWPREYVNITTAYGQFGEWGANVQSNQDWYHHYTDGKVYKY